MLRVGEDPASDKKFAHNVGVERGGELAFLTPEAAFGPAVGVAPAAAPIDVEVTPPEALAARWSLLGGYLRGPLMLMLCGAQGSGKSFATDLLLAAAAGGTWTIVCQDTISNGAAARHRAAIAHT